MFRCLRLPIINSVQLQGQHRTHRIVLSQHLQHSETRSIPLLSLNAIVALLSRARTYHPQLQHTHKHKLVSLTLTFVERVES